MSKNDPWFFILCLLVPASAYALAILGIRAVGRKAKNRLKERALIKTDLPALNWLVHVLAENVGRVEWIDKTPEELAKSKSDYPYDVIQHPIPPGKDIVVNGSRTLTIRCDSEDTRDLLIRLAVEYINLEKQRNHAIQELGSSTWHKIETLRPYSPASPFHERGRRFIVYSPVLPYITHITGGVTTGFRDKNQWYIIINGKQIKHRVTHFRHLPPWPWPIVTLDSDSINKDVEKLKSILNEI